MSDLLTDIHRKLKQEKEKPDKRSADEQGVINQAKSLLIEKNGMTEEEAHQMCIRDSTYCARVCKTGK